MVESTIGLKLVNFFKDDIKNAGKGIKDEFLQAFFSGMTNYIDNFYDKFSRTKTFIYRDERVNFYDIFYPVTLRQVSKNKFITEIQDIKDFFFNKRFVTIVGNAGSGKSMLTKHIFLSIVDQFYSLPVLIELRNLNEFEGTLEDYISNIFLKNKLARSERILDRILKEGNFVFILDGYDEIFSEHKDRITNQIEEFADLYHKNSFILTSRPGANAESLQRFDNLYVQPLNAKQINEFVSLQFKNHENKESIGKIISVIEKKDNQDFKDYLSSPLLLSMFIFTFNNYPELPKTKSKFYWNVFDTLCTKHDAFTKKGFWLHERKSKLLNEEFEVLLKWFSYLTFFKGKYTFDQEYLQSQLRILKEKLGYSSSIEDIIYDLSVSISILIQDGTDFTFPHKSLQEYFTAFLIKGLDDEQKQNIYTEKFKTLQRRTRGGNSNFYKLCFELDKYYFSKYFLVKEFENFDKLIDNTTKETVAKSIIKIFRMKFDFIFDEGNYKLSSFTFNDKMLDCFLFFIVEDNYFPSFQKLNENIEMITTLLNENQIKLKDRKNENTRKFSTINLGEDIDNNFYEYLRKGGVEEDFHNLYLTISEKIDIINKETETETINTKDLLNL